MPDHVGKQRQGHKGGFLRRGAGSSLLVDFSQDWGAEQDLAGGIWTGQSWGGSSEQWFELMCWTHDDRRGMGHT